MTVSRTYTCNSCGLTDGSSDPFERIIVTLASGKYEEPETTVLHACRSCIPDALLDRINEIDTVYADGTTIDMIELYSSTNPDLPDEAVRFIEGLL